MDSTRFRSFVVATLTAAVLFTVPATAAADVTAFLGWTNKPASRVGTGISVGLKLLVVGVEF